MGESFIRGGNKVTLEQTPKQSERMSHAAFWGKNILGRENTCKEYPDREANKEDSLAAEG